MKENNFNDVFSHIDRTFDNKQIKEQEYKNRLIKFNNYYLIFEEALNKCKSDSQNFFFKILHTDYSKNEKEIILDDKSRLAHTAQIQISFDDNPIPVEYILKLITNHNTAQLSLTCDNSGKLVTDDFDFDNTSSIEFKNKVIDLFKELHN